MSKINIVQAQRIETEMLRETVEILKRNNVTFYMAYGSALGTVRHGGPIPWDADTDILVPVNQLNKAVECLKNELSKRFCIHSLDTDKKYKLVFPRVALPNSSSDQIHVDIFPLYGLPDIKEHQISFNKKIDNWSEMFLKNKHFRQFIVHPSPIKNMIGWCIENFYPPVSKKQLHKKYYKLLNKYPYDRAEYVSSAGACYGARNILRKEMYGTAEWKGYSDFKVPVPKMWDEYLKNYYKNYMEYPPEVEREKGLALTFEINDADYENIKDVLENEP